MVAATVIKSINWIPSNCCSVKSGTYASNTIGHPILIEVSSPWSNGLALFGYSKINDLSVEELKKLSLILFYSFKSYDLAGMLIQRISEIESVNYIEQYNDHLRTIKINRNY